MRKVKDMSTTTKKAKITVHYWRGTMPLAEGCNTYAQAMKIASRNQNKYLPRFEDAEGRELHDDGNGLGYPDESGKWIYVA